MANEDTRLTIGMPLYNNAPTIRRALDSLVAQSYRDFRLILGDDASTDGTAEVCDEYAGRDARITVVHHTRNLNYGNFRYLLEQARTPLFMFAAGDDYWHPEYVQRMLDALDANPAAVGAVSKVVFVKDGSIVGEAPGTYALTEAPATNITRFLAAQDDNSRMYGVFRTEVARRAFPPNDFFAYDWAFTAGTLLEGTHVQVPEVLMWRDHTHPARYIEYVRRDARGRLDRLFPMLPLTRDLVGRLKVPKTFAVLRRLVLLNLNFHRHYMRTHHPAIAAVTERALSRLPD
jgi:glycosyltransferase involved in cell wall biosynthesis